MGRQNNDATEGRKDLKTLYRLSIVEHETHKHVRSILLTKLGLIIVAVSAVLLFSLFIYCLIAFTPIRTTIPGYPDAHSKKVAVANAIKIDSLESAITRWNLYAENLSRVLAGEATINFDSIVRSGSTRYLSDKTEAQLAASDSLLRDKVRNEDRFGVSGNIERELPIQGRDFFVPVKGVIAKDFDPILHTGADITAAAGSVVCSTLDGTVIASGWSDEGDGGYYMIIQHSGDIVSVYHHTSKLLKKVGDRIDAGTAIAILGESNGKDRKSDFLHFEIWHSGESADPSKYINF